MCTPVQFINLHDSAQAVVVYTLVTATWKVYSVIRLLVLFEKLASTLMTELSGSFRETSKTIPISFCDTTIVEVFGSESSGKAELKFQSSSADVAPFAPEEGFTAGGDASSSIDDG